MQARSSTVRIRPQGEVAYLFAAIVESSNDAIITKNLDGVILTWNPAAQRVFGYSAEEAIGQPITIIIPPWLYGEEKDILTRLCSGERIDRYETRRLKRDGRLLDVSLTISPVRDERGMIVGASKILRDDTENKQARAALLESQQRLEREVARARTLQRRLIDVQEGERSRIARDLHDDVVQQLAILSLRLDMLTQSVRTSSTKQKIEEVRSGVTSLLKDVHEISHRLHPARLDYLGIAEASAALCHELSTQHGVEISFHTGSALTGLSKRNMVCLYRVLQEALQNAIKHSGARKVEVFLCRTGDRMELTVSDHGAGFDLVSTQGRGLGLVSMEERLQTVDGLLAIRSEPKHGTTIKAWVPLLQDESEGSEQS
jgi:PAS domain S-box-containing protein